MSRNWKLSRRISAFSLAAGALVLTACAKDSPTTPIAAPAFSIAGEYARAGIVGQQLQSPLVVQVRDAAGRPLRGQTVNFVVSGNGGSVIVSGTTDENGRATAAWLLGTAVGIDTVTASWGAETVRFVAQAMPGTLSQLLMVSGDQAQVEAGSPASLVLKAVDAYGNVIADAALTWLPLDGGLVSAASGTDANGIGRATLQTEVGSSGLLYTVQAQSADGSVTVSFLVIVM